MFKNTLNKKMCLQSVDLCTMVAKREMKLAPELRMNFLIKDLNYILNKIFLN